MKSSSTISVRTGLLMDHRPWEANREHGATLVAHADLAAVLGDQSLDQRQTQPARSELRFLGRESRFENPRNQQPRNPRSRVAHLGADLSVPLAQMDHDLAA